MFAHHASKAITSVAGAPAHHSLALTAAAYAPAATIPWISHPHSFGFQPKQLIRRLTMPEKKQTPFRPELLPADLQGQVEPDYERLVDAIFPSEGIGKNAPHGYGIKSVKVSGRDEARQVALNTVRNNYKRWQDAGGKWKDGKPVTYFEFLAKRFVPPEVDPVGHKNWLINVPHFYNKKGRKQQEAPLADVPQAPLPAYDPALRSYSVE